ncbi:flagellin N-terminal helical domain-containing protein [Sphingomonas sp. PAMC 26621]|uniref:flagellin N-terminal helical domain-containing protein n=1 Tax=Sphingomonas sp. PAMC 26621 TaxID=1112213 RepID=UPI0002F4E82D|nr:flagellin [Sphingomonas sp. PAMC 26621]
MSLSVNTNNGAMAALQSLNATAKALSTTSNRITTGLNVSSTKDDSAKYTTAQKLRGDLGSLSAVTSSLGRAKSTVDVAVTGAEQVSDLVNQMKAKATEASDTGIDVKSRTAIGSDLVALKKQINSIVQSSDFNGTNLLKTDAASTGKVSALLSTDTTQTLDVANIDLESGATTAFGASGATPDDTKLDLSGATGAATAATLATALGAYSDSIATKLSTLGSASRQIDGQTSFVSKLSDAIDSGIGNLVDADLAKESAKLQALQVKQQLGVQALSIANQAPQTITSLFR